MLVMAAMIFAPSVSATQVNEVEIRGEMVDEKVCLLNASNLMWDALNFPAFWLDLDTGDFSEKLYITQNLSNADRTIQEGNLIYETVMVPQEYEIHEGLGITIEGEMNYSVIGFMAEKYVCLDGDVDTLAKLLVEFEDDDKKTLDVGEMWNLGGGYVLSPSQIDLEGDKVMIRLYKNDKEIDAEVVSNGDVYVYTEDIRGCSDDVPLAHCYIDAVFRGTESNCVQIEYMFLVDNAVLEIDGGDEFGIMEVKTAGGNSIKMTNEEDTVDLDSDSIEYIMGDVYFRSGDDDDYLRFYPAYSYTYDVPECPACPECEDCEPCVNHTPCEPCPVMTSETVTVAEYIYVNGTETDPVESNMLPGFEAVFAIMGLLTIVWLIGRQKD